jgi:hypothetical protein
MVIAETELTLLKIRAIRAQLISHHASDLGMQPLPEGELREQAAFLAALPVLLKLDRYERQALSRRERAMREFARL